MKDIIRTDYLVVGASYAGSILAAKLAEYGHTLIVDKAVPGELMNCGGGLPEKTFRQLEVNIPFVKANKILMNVKGKNTSFPCRYVVVDRRELNDALFQKALSAGVKFARMTYSEHDHVKHAALFKFKGECCLVEYKKLIFADGFHTDRVRIPQVKQGKLPCGSAKVQIIEGETHFPGTLYFKITEENSFGYSWVFPMSDKRMNIGAGGFQTGNVPDSLIDDLKASENLNGKIIKRGGGVLPVLPLSRVQDGDTYLFGNAAGMVYALNGEGLKHINDISDKFAKAIIKEKYLNLQWKSSFTYLKLKFASVGLRGLLSGSKIFGRSLYPAACRFAAGSRRIVRM